MKGLPVLMLLLSAALLCSAGPKLEPVTCADNSSASAAHMAMHHINNNHDHGYKFKLNEIQSIKVDKVEGGCHIMLELDLRETKCNVVNPKAFEDCDIREVSQTEVMAKCSVMMCVNGSDASVTKYHCDTSRVHTPSELVRICPDCPQLLPLNHAVGLESVHKAVHYFNQNTSNQHLFVLQEVGRMTSGYMMMAGMQYYAQFVLVETFCPRLSRIAPEACNPLCPDRAQHAVCRSSCCWGVPSVECEIFPAMNTTVLEPGQREPICMRRHVRGPPPHAHDQGPTSHAHDHGPPPHAHDHGPTSHAHDHGPPPHAHDHGPTSHAHDHGPPPHAHDHGPMSHAHDQGPTSHAHDHGPPPHAHDHGPTSHAHDQGPTSHAHDHGPPPHAHDHGPTSHAHDHGPTSHAHDHGPTSHAHGQGPPPQNDTEGTPTHADGKGPPPHADGKGPPPHAHGKGPPPGLEKQAHQLPFHHCHGLLSKSDPALHPICPWPAPPPPVPH